MLLDFEKIVEIIVRRELLSTSYRDDKPRFKDLKPKFGIVVGYKPAAVALMPLRGFNGIPVFPVDRKYNNITFIS